MAPVFSYYERLMGGRGGGAGGPGPGGGGRPLERRIFGGAPDLTPRKNWTSLGATAPEGAVDPTTGLGLDAMYQGDAPLKPVRLTMPGDLGGMGGHGPGMGGGGRGHADIRRPVRPTSDWRGFRGWQGGNGLRTSGAGSSLGGSSGGGIYAYVPGQSGVMNAQQFNRFVGGGGFGYEGGGRDGGSRFRGGSRYDEIASRPGGYR